VTARSLSVTASPIPLVSLLLPLQEVAMTRIHDFVVDLARAGKKFKEIQETVQKVYGDKSLKKTAIYEILSRVKAGKSTVDKRGFNTKRTKRTAAAVAAISAAIEADRRITLEKLTAGCTLSYGTVSNIHHS
jgi:hypothetical protein